MARPSSSSWLEATSVSNDVSGQQQIKQQYTCGQTKSVGIIIKMCKVDLSQMLDDKNIYIYIVYMYIPTSG